MRHLIHTCSLVLVSCTIMAQSYTNDWIDYSKPYYKMKIAENGIYHITYNDLLLANIPLSTDPRKFQIFAKGQEQYIYVEGESNGIFEAGEFIEFYAEANDGWLDTGLFDSSHWHTNTNYSFFTDSSTYYLTWDDNATPKRFSIENDINFNGYSALSYFTNTIRTDYTNQYASGFYTQNSASFDPEYTEAEGWVGTKFSVPTSKSVATPNIYTSGPNSQIEIGIVGRNIKQHSVAISFSSINQTISFDGTKTNILNYSISSSDLSTTNNFSFTPTLTNDLVSIAYIKIQYPSIYDLNNATDASLTIANQSGAKSYIEITDFNTLSSTPILYDLTNHKKITVIEDAGLLKALIPNSGNNRECFLSSSSGAKPISRLLPVGNGGYFTNYDPITNDSSYIIISHKRLYSDNNGNNWVQQYQNYRESNGGGNFTVINADINELYDQFSFGVSKHPLAIKEFANHAINNWPAAPKYLLLLGKGISSDLSRQDQTTQSNNLIPTYGNSSSDILLTAGLNGTQLEPAINTGRIAAKSGEEVQFYLDKLQQYENNSIFYPQLLNDKKWMKQIIHFAGGGDINEQNTFQNYLSIYENMLEDTLFGGHVSSFFKNSTDPIQISISDSVKSLVNKGVSIMTFFGHASGNGFDQSIDFPDNYSNNNGKYPLLIANSCLVGDIFQIASNSTSEQWTIHPRGVIGFLASVSYGVPNLLNTYSRELIRNISSKHYGKSIGHCIKKAIEEVQIYPTLKKTCLGMTYHGDPAVIINSHPKPDYTLTENDIYFTPTPITTEIDSIEINIIVSNIGKAINRTLELEITRSYPAESNVTDATYYLYLSPSTYYKDTATLKLPLDIENSLGLNQFSIRIDPMNNIEEISEANNDLTNIPLLLKSSDITPIYPFPYAIIPNQQITLKASTGNPFEVVKTYQFEIDNTDLFSTPLATKSITQSGGVVKWDPQDDPQLSSILSNAQDSTVFFWRTRLDSTSIADSNNTWKESSFQYIQNKTGWSQDHFFQFKHNDFTLIDYNRDDLTFNYISTPKQIQCNVLGVDGNGIYVETNYLIENATMLTSSYNETDAIIIAIIDPLTLLPIKSDEHNYNQTCYNTCGPYNAFIFHCPPGNNSYSDNIANMLQDSIPDSTYVLFYTFQRGNFKNWGANLHNVMQSLGSTKIITGPDTLGNDIPYAFFVKKGDLNTVQEEAGISSSDKIQLNAALVTNYDYGYINSIPIGPAKSWSTLHWKIDLLETNDSVRLEIYGIDYSGQEFLLPTFTNLIPSSNPIDISTINATTYPKIKLRVYLKDDSLKTSAQLDRWQVFYEKYPEAALNGSLNYTFIADSLDEGEQIELSTVLESISDVDMDSIHFSYWIVDKARNVIPIQSVIKRPLAKSPDTINIDLSYSTTGLPGQNSLWIEANPINTSTGLPYQNEQYHFNNIAEIPFYVRGDYKNPLLDITFDGVHILDGDIVSAKPEIMIQLTDENTFLALDTNSLINVYLIKPNEASPQLLTFDDNILTFIPADLPDNKAKVIYTPTFDEDGIYKLQIQATDKSKNESGDIDYRISFEVINKASITDMLNWPNPFSTKTRFVFTLTGSQVPEIFRIRIMTISGKVVKEIFSDELGSIHIGKNITSYAWDGTDQYGDPLANGIYLYKVDVRLNGEHIEKRQTSADKYFHKGFGKMYLMR